MEDLRTLAPPRSRRRWLMALGIGGVLIAVPIAWLAALGAGLDEAIPNPNGYDDLVAAGREIAGDFVKADPKVAGNDELLRAIVAENANALARARVGLGRASAVPLADDGSLQDHIDDFNAVRKVGRLLACEAALAEREGRKGEAASGCVDLIRLGRAASSGGLVIDRIAEGAIQNPGVEGLARLAATLPADEARRLAREVERLDRDREPLTRVFDRDLRCTLAWGGWQARVAYSMNRTAMQAMLGPAKTATDQADRRAQALMRLLATTLALRAYRLDHPDAPDPADLTALVPAFLDAVPADPFGTGPLGFREGDEPAPYSVGFDGATTGGRGPRRGIRRAATSCSARRPRFAADGAIWTIDTRRIGRSRVAGYDTRGAGE